MPVHAAGFGDLDYVAALRRLRASRFGAVHLEPLVAAPAMVVRDVGREDAAKVTRVQNDDGVETLPARCRAYVDEHRACQVRRAGLQIRSDGSNLQLCGIAWPKDRSGVCGGGSPLS